MVEAVSSVVRGAHFNWLLCWFCMFKLGWISIACWSVGLFWIWTKVRTELKVTSVHRIIVYSPQIIENYQLQSGEGLSLLFIYVWLLGDVCNLVGAAMAGLLPTVIILGVYVSFIFLWLSFPVIFTTGPDSTLYVTQFCFAKYIITGGSGELGGTFCLGTSQGRPLRKHACLLKVVQWIPPKYHGPQSFKFSCAIWPLSHSYQSPAWQRTPSAIRFPMTMHLYSSQIRSWNGKYS